MRRLRHLKRLVRSALRTWLSSKLSWGEVSSRRHKMLNMFITGRLRFPTREGSSPKLPSPWCTKRLQAEFQGEPQLSEEVSTLTRVTLELKIPDKETHIGMPAAAIDSENNFLSGATTSVQNHRTGHQSTENLCPQQFTHILRSRAVSKQRQLLSVFGFFVVC